MVRTDYGARIVPYPCHLVTDQRAQSGMCRAGLRGVPTRPSPFWFNKVIHAQGNNNIMTFIAPVSFNKIETQCR